MKILRSGRRGQNLVEFAILLPVLVLFLLIIIDLGRVVYSYSALHNAVREGARYGIINPGSSAGIESRVRQYAIGLNQNSLTVAVDSPNEDTIEVTGIYEFHSASPILTLITGSSVFTLQGVSAMQIED